jgi:hypothetical protein
MVLPPFEAGLTQATAAEALPATAPTPVGAEGTVQRTATGIALSFLEPLPSWP